MASPTSGQDDEPCFVIGYLSGQDGPILPVRDCLLFSCKFVVALVAISLLPDILRKTSGKILPGQPLCKTIRINC